MFEFRANIDFNSAYDHDVWGIRLSSSFSSYCFKMWYGLHVTLINRYSSIDSIVDENFALTAQDKNKIHKFAKKYV